jgi:histidinol-phosphate/aromatic aminotransferase/cobyric acid decarboxylase-like protein
MFAHLKKQGVLVRNFPELMRVTVGTTEENQAFLDAFKSGRPER